METVGNSKKALLPVTWKSLLGGNRHLDGRGAVWVGGGCICFFVGNRVGVARVTGPFVKMGYWRPLRSCLVFRRGNAQLESVHPPVGNGYLFFFIVCVAEISSSRMSGLPGISFRVDTHTLPVFPMGLYQHKLGGNHPLIAKCAFHKLHRRKLR